MATLDESEVSVGAWAWINECRRQTQFPVLTSTRLRGSWDGLFVAPCPCGRDALWNAWTSHPQYCECTERRRPERKEC